MKLTDGLGGKECEWKTKVNNANYKFNTWKFQAQTWGEHVVYRNCFWHSEQFLYTTSSPHVLQKEELQTKIYLYYTKIPTIEKINSPPREPNEAMIKVKKVKNKGAHAVK